MNSQKLTKPLYLVLAVSIFLFSSMALNARSFPNAPAYNKSASIFRTADTDGDGVSDKKDKCPDTPKGVTVSKTGCPLDADKDGVVDYLDKCPRAIGTASMNGCPDTDKDGISDFEDKCPDAPGLARFTGCPDSDGDGIQDALDKCPNAKGLDMFKGCPDTDGDGVEDAIDKCADSEKGYKVDATGCLADQDKDGIIDSEDRCSDTERGIKVDEKGCPADSDGDGLIDSKDRCPTTKGMGSINGCPEIKAEVKKRLQFAARGINFETDKATLKTTSYPMLDEVVSILGEYSDYNLTMGGHTDNVGEDKYNMELSQARVNTVKAYLVSKAVALSRIDATGYGESKPVATNTTSDGRLQNRRVELELVLN